MKTQVIGDGGESSDLKANESGLINKTVIQAEMDRIRKTLSNRLNLWISTDSHITVLKMNQNKQGCELTLVAYKEVLKDFERFETLREILKLADKI